jgi:hypothetical protein
VFARDRALEALAALALHVALRERGDADWFRNPRSAEQLRVARAARSRRRLSGGLRLGPPRACDQP